MLNLLFTLGLYFRPFLNIGICLFHGNYFTLQSYPLSCEVLELLTWSLWLYKLPLWDEIVVLVLVLHHVV